MADEFRKRMMLTGLDMPREDSEIVAYIEGLLDHQQGCAAASCGTCALLSDILEGVRKRLFTSAVYTSPGSPPAEAYPAKPARRAHRRASR
jgi:hypothetical protein